MNAEGRALVEHAHREAMARIAGQVSQKDELATIHCSQLAEAAPHDPLFREWNTYRREVGRLLAEGHAGRFVLIKDENIVEIFDREEPALEAGHKRLTRGAFLVHQVREREPLLRIRGYNLPCPSTAIPLAKPA